MPNEWATPDHALAYLERMRDIVQQQATAEQQRADRLAALLERIADEARYVRLETFLELWRAGLTDAARRVGGALNEPFPEEAAVRFLLDERQLAEKADAFRAKHGAAAPHLVDFIIAEHHARDGDTTEAVAGLRRAAATLRGIVGDKKVGADKRLLDYINSRLEALAHPQEGER